MEARDFRRIGRATQEELRRRALFLIERQGLMCRMTVEPAPSGRARLVERQ
jgi:hypothetical protein